MGTSVSVRIDLDGTKQRPQVVVREEDEGPVVYLTLSLDEGQVSICLRDREQAKALVAAAREGLLALDR